MNTIERIEARKYFGGGFFTQSGWKCVTDEEWAAIKAVIDAAGDVSDHGLGTRSHARLRAALAKLQSEN